MTKTTVTQHLHHYNIRKARPEEASAIATLIMTAMTDVCCMHFAGEKGTLHDFHAMMTRLVQRTDSQYSYTQTVVATDRQDRPVGCIVVYNGAELKCRRKAFISECLHTFGCDHSNMPDETHAGEYYIDSLAVDKDHRHRGLATALLKTAIQTYGDRGCVALLVDQENEKARKLYQSFGFEADGENSWGGHPMFHMLYKGTAKET